MTVVYKIAGAFKLSPNFGHLAVAHFDMLDASKHKPKVLKLATIELEHITMHLSIPNLINPLHREHNFKGLLKRS